MPNSISEIEKQIQEWSLKQVQEMQQNLFDSIRDETPVDTGRAQDGWISNPINNVGDIGIIRNDVPYIGWLEFGTPKTFEHAMVRRNIQRITGTLK